MNETIGYKLFRVDKLGYLRYLYHTHNKSSFVVTNEWLVSKKKWVHNPGEKTNKYRSGFHFFMYPEDVDRFFKLTKGKYVVRAVKVKNFWPKPRSSSHAWLAESILIPIKGQ